MYVESHSRQGTKPPYLHPICVLYLCHNGTISSQYLHALRPNPMCPPPHPTPPHTVPFPILWPYIIALWDLVLTRAPLRTTSGVAANTYLRAIPAKAQISPYLHHIRVLYMCYNGTISSQYLDALRPNPMCPPPHPTPPHTVSCPIL